MPSDVSELPGEQSSQWDEVRSVVESKEEEMESLRKQVENYRSIEEQLQQQMLLRSEDRKFINRLKEENNNLVTSDKSTKKLLHQEIASKNALATENETFCNLQEV